jgi:hypothetical protein
MKQIYYPLILASLLSCAGCASLTPPDEKNMAEVPVVNFGDAAPEGKKIHEFVVHYPAGTSLPVVASVQGTLLEKSDQSNLSVTLKKDIYVYRNWVSFDGKNWQSGDKVVASKFKIDLPGLANGKNPGTLSAEFNLK